jgi:hypothetical protein
LSVQHIEQEGRRKPSTNVLEMLAEAPAVEMDDLA